MCRFLLVQSKEKIQPKKLLHQFAEMAKESHAPDGDWQGDGWGIAWVDDNQWQAKKSLSPIWKEIDEFDAIPETNTFAVHARSASFPQHKDYIEFNQPYISENYAFVFNGLLKGVSLQDIPGRIGAEKIWYLVRQELKKSTPKKALEKVKELLINNSKEIIALNMGLATPEEMYSVCYFTKHPDYYQLQYFTNHNLQIICSEKLAGMI